MIKCTGCGSTLQFEDKNKEGYIDESLIDSAKYCKRCFRLKNYGEAFVSNNSFNYNLMFSKIDPECLILHFVDIFDIYNISKLDINNKKILVITKRDIMLKTMNEKKLVENLKNMYQDYINIIIISSKKNYNFDNILDLINKYCNNKEVYIIGSSNSGKSTFINRFAKDYSSEISGIVTSYMPNTTIDVISIKINDDITLMDTPGFILENSILNYTPEEEMQKIIPKVEMKPRIFQTKSKCSFFVDKYCRIDYLDDYLNDFLFLVSNDINVEKRRMDSINNEYDEYKATRIKLNRGEDLIVNGLLIFRCSNECNLNIYVIDNKLINIKEKIF